MSPDHALSRDAEVDLAAILNRAWKARYRILMLGLFFAVLSYFVASALQPRYRSESKVLIQTTDAVLTRRQQQTGADQNPSLAEASVASQVELLRSPQIAEKVIEQLNLADLAEFDPARQTGFFSVLLGQFGGGTDPLSASPKQRILEQFKERLSVFQAERTRVLVVQFWSHDRDLAAAVANAVSEEYLKLQEELKRGVGPEELASLKPELDALRAKVIEAEEKVAEFRANNDLLQTGENRNVATQDLTQATGELSRVRASLSEARARAKAVERAVKNGSTASVGNVLNSSLIQNLSQTLANLNGQLAALETNLLPKHPRVIGLKSQISAVNQQLRNEMRKIMTSLREEARILAEREADLIAKRNTFKSEAARADRGNVQLRALEREASAQRELLNAYLVQFRDANSRQDRKFLPADAIVFSIAAPATKAYFPRKGPIVAAASLGSMLLYTLGILAFGVMAGDLSSRDNEIGATANVGLQRIDATPSLAPAIAGNEIGAADQEAIKCLEDALMAMENSASPSVAPVQPAVPAPVFVAANPEGAGSTRATLAMDDGAPLAPHLEDITPQEPALKILPVSLSALIQALSLRPSARLVVMAPPGQQRDPVAVAMVRALSRTGRAVLLDMSNDAISSTLMRGRASEPGLHNILSGQSAIGNAIWPDRQSSAHVVPLGDSNAALRPDSGSLMKKVLTALQQTHRFVVIDSPSTRAGAISRLANEETLVIISCTTAKPSAINELIDQLDVAGYKDPILLDMRSDNFRAQTSPA